VFSAYASEVFLVGLQGHPEGPVRRRATRSACARARPCGKIILPQLVRIALPGLGNLWMILIKDTALISVIGLTDILRQTGIAAKVTKEAFLLLRHRLPAVPGAGDGLLRGVLRIEPACAVRG
jgi:polar amino acid transport system permease protein